MADCIAVLNAGSSSIKFALHEVGDERLRLRGQVESIGLEPKLKARDATGAVVAEHQWLKGALDHAGATREIVSVIRDWLGGERVAAVGHRVVHGGPHFADPMVIDAGLLCELEAFVPLAPLHQPHNLAPIRAIAEHAPAMRQVACFDTGFHRGQPRLAQQYALPRRFFDEGVRRYGFHGLSYEYVSDELRRLAPDLAAGRVIMAHLGNGASLCAMLEGRSVASTMGFSAAEGLMMGTRCGAIDPGVILYLLGSQGMDVPAVQDLIYRRSGLLGVSGLSSDMRSLRGSPAPEAAEAIDLFIYRITREIGSLVAALGGLDGLVFTAGIGENDAATRRDVAAGCAWLGVRLREPAGATGARRISAPDSRVEAWVVPTDEERVIARHTARVLGL
jgi:acetate kinase